MSNHHHATSILRHRTGRARDAELRQRVLRIIGKRQSPYPVVAAEMGMCPSTFSRWIQGTVIPTKWLPAVEAWLTRAGQ